MKQEKPNLSYQAAIDELEEIVQKIEDDTIPVDDLAANVKRAAELIELCKGVLRQTEAEVNQILNDIQAENPAD